MSDFDSLETLLNILPDRVKNNIFTPVKIAKEMIDSLPDDIWNSQTKFLDPVCKSGIFLYEIQKKLMKAPSLIADFPDTKARRQHILQNQLYGIAMDGFTQLISIRTVYGHLTEDNNIISIENYTRKIKTLTAKEFKNTIEKEFKQEMKFDVVIGNPPYNRGMDLDFVDLGYKLSSKYTCMITPAKWQTADADQQIVSKISYGEFRQLYVPHMRYVKFYPDCKDVFENAIQPDGITYYLLDKDNHENCEVINECTLMPILNTSETRNISDRKTLINIGNEIVNSLGNYNSYKFNTKMCENHRFQLWINNQLPGSGFYRLSKTNKSIIVISTYQIIDRTKDDGLQSGTATCVFTSNDINEINSYISWIYSKFVRFFVIINISKLGGLLSDDYFRFVPAPPSGKFDHIYTDEELYRAFNLPQKYIDIIESVIKERK